MTATCGKAQRNRGAAMTALPAATAKKLGLVIDLDTCVGCQACATSCKEWNTRRLLRAAHRPGALRRRSARRLAQPRARLRGGRGRGEPDGALSALVPALRGARLRHRVPDRRLLQARRGRHRAGRPGHLHRLQAVLVGLPLRRARVRLRRRRDEEVHAVRRPHLQRAPAPRRTASRPACAPARRGRAISATSAIPTAPCPSWWPSAAASICCPSSATSRSTSICRRAPAATDHRRQPARAAGRARRRRHRRCGRPPVRLGRPHAVAVAVSIPGTCCPGIQPSIGDSALA